MDTTCNEYEDGSALHIAAANLSVGAAKILMSFGADTELRDNLARSPIDCVPEPEDFLIPDAGELVEAMASILLRGGIKEDNNNGSTKRPYGEASTKAISGRTVLKALGLKVRAGARAGSSNAAHTMMLVEERKDARARSERGDGKKRLTEEETVLTKKC